MDSLYCKGRPLITIQSLLVLRIADGSAMQVADKTDKAVETTATNPVVVELVDEDIPGATLSEPRSKEQCCPALVAPVSWYQGSAFLE